MNDIDNYTNIFKDEFLKSSCLFEISLDDAISKMITSLEIILKYKPIKLKLEISNDKSIFYTFKTNVLNLYIDHYLELEPNDNEEIIVSGYLGNFRLMNIAGRLDLLESYLNKHLLT